MHINLSQKVTVGLIVLLSAGQAMTGAREAAMAVAGKSAIDLAIMGGLAAVFIISTALLYRAYIAPVVDPAILQAAVALQKSLGLSKKDE